MHWNSQQCSVMDLIQYAEYTQSTTRVVSSCWSHIFSWNTNSSCSTLWKQCVYGLFMAKTKYYKQHNYKFASLLWISAWKYFIHNYTTPVITTKCSKFEWWVPAIKASSASLWQTLQEHLQHCVGESRRTNAIFSLPLRWSCLLPCETTILFRVLNNTRKLWNMQQQSAIRLS